MEEDKVEDIEEDDDWLLQPRSYKTIIVEAQLLSSSPERVFEFLERKAIDPNKLNELFNFNHDYEPTLLKLNNPLINLGLAKYGFSKDVLRALFYRNRGNSEENLAIRLSVLSNCCLRRFNPEYDLFGGYTDQMNSWLTEASSPEITALFENPTLLDNFLSNFFEGKETWQILSENQRFDAIASLALNPIMKQKFVESNYSYFMDEYYHNNQFQQAWSMASTLPVNFKWARWLANLLEEIVPEYHGQPDAANMANRWFPTLDYEIKEENKSNELGFLGEFQRVRFALGRLLVKSYPSLLINHDDIAFRFTGYRFERISEEQLFTAFERDGEMILSYVIENDAIWFDEKSRDTLLDILNKCKGSERFFERKAAFRHKEAILNESFPEIFADPVDCSKSNISHDDLSEIVVQIISKIDSNIKSNNQTLVTTFDERLISNTQNTFMSFESRFDGLDKTVEQLIIGMEKNNNKLVNNFDEKLINIQNIFTRLESKYRDGSKNSQNERRAIQIHIDLLSRKIQKILCFSIVIFIVFIVKFFIIN